MAVLSGSSCNFIEYWFYTLELPILVTPEEKDFKARIDLRP